MSWDPPPPPGFTLVSSKKRSSKAAKSAAGKGTAERQFERKVESPSPGPLSEGLLSRPENSGTTSGTGSSGRVVGSLAGLTVVLAPSTGLAGSSAEGQPGPSANSGRISGETRPVVDRNECHKCKGTDHYRANCLMRSRSGSRSGPMQGKKHKRSGATGQTSDGKQAKSEDPSRTVAIKYHKPDFDWSQVTVVLLKLNGQPMSLEEYEEEKGNFVLKELDITQKDGSMVDIDEWSCFQDRVEVKFPDVAPTELFWKLMGDCSIMSKSKWEEEHFRLHYFTSKIDKATMTAPFEGLRLMVDARRKAMGIPGIFRLEKVICQTPTGTIVLVSCDEEARKKWQDSHFFLAKVGLIFSSHEDASYWKIQ